MNHPYITVNAEELSDALKRASDAHHVYETNLGHADPDWPTWYAEYIVRANTQDFTKEHAYNLLSAKVAWLPRIDDFMMPPTMDDFMKPCPTGFTVGFSEECERRGDNASFIGGHDHDN